MAETRNTWQDWEIVRLIGEGSFGGVYEIKRTLPGGEVERAALKRLSVPRNRAEITELVSQQYDTASITAHFAEQMQELVREYSFLQKLSSNSNVVHCQDMRTVQHKDGIGWDIYIRMELLTPLKQYLGKDYIFDEEQVIRLALDMCNALRSCHEKNIIHRDIKPENIMVDADGHFKLGDFGIAKISEKTATGTLTGTYSYMAPEIANRQHYGVSADVYSLGLVMYWMMNQRALPFLPPYPQIPTAAQRQEAQERRFNGERFPDPLFGSRGLTRIVMKACAFNPKERYHSIVEMMDEIRNYSMLISHDNINWFAKECQSNLSLEAWTKGWKRTLMGLAIVVLICAIGWVGNWKLSQKEAIQDSMNELDNVVHDLPINVPIQKVNNMRNSLGIENNSAFLDDKVMQDGFFWGQTKHTLKEVESIIFCKTLENYPVEAWDVSENCDCTVIAWMDGSTLTVAANGYIALPENSSYLFANFLNLREIQWRDAVLSENVTNMAAMFFDCRKLNSLDLSGFNTRKTTDMSGMFCCCFQLEYLDLSGFETENVVNMSQMFSGCINLGNLNISGFNTSNVTDMSWMFKDCNKLASIYLLGFQTPSVVNMEKMFSGCSSLSKLDISNFDVSNVISMREMFEGCRNIKELDISGWDMQNVIDKDGMFDGCAIYQSPFLESWDITTTPLEEGIMVDFTATVSGSPDNVNVHFIVMQDGIVYIDMPCISNGKQYVACVQLDSIEKYTYCCELSNDTEDIRNVLVIT